MDGQSEHNADDAGFLAESPERYIERRRSNGERFAAVDQRFADMQEQIDRRFSAVHTSIAENTELTKQADERSKRIEANTQALVSIFDGAGKSASFFKNLAHWARKAAIFIGPFVAVIGGIWALMHGKWPESGG